MVNVFTHNGITKYRQDVSAKCMVDPGLRNPIQQNDIFSFPALIYPEKKNWEVQKKKEFVFHQSIQKMSCIKQAGFNQCPIKSVMVFISSGITGKSGLL